MAFGKALFQSFAPSLVPSHPSAEQILHSIAQEPWHGQAHLMALSDSLAEHSNDPEHQKLADTINWLHENSVPGNFGRSVEGPMQTDTSKPNKRYWPSDPREVQFGANFNQTLRNGMYQHAQSPLTFRMGENFAKNRWWPSMTIEVRHGDKVSKSRRIFHPKDLPAVLEKMNATHTDRDRYAERYGKRFAPEQPSNPVTKLSRPHKYTLRKQPVHSAPVILERLANRLISEGRMPSPGRTYATITGSMRHEDKVALARQPDRLPIHTVLTSLYQQGHPLAEALDHLHGIGKGMTVLRSDLTPDDARAVKVPIVKGLALHVQRVHPETGEHHWWYSKGGVRRPGTHRVGTLPPELLSTLMSSTPFNQAAIVTRPGARE